MAWRTKLMRGLSALPVTALPHAAPFPALPLPGEPAAPQINTAVPGPASTAAILEFQGGWGGAGSAIELMQDVKASQGCYFADVDGNMLLDMFGHISSIPLGYNHPALMEAARSEEMASAQVHRSALGLFPPEGWGELVAQTLGKMAPPGMTRVQTMGCGSTANENAFKVAFIAAASKRRAAEGRGLDEFSEEELRSSMLNAAPGSTADSILSFEGAFHGRTMGALSCTRSKEIHKLDAPAFDWPVAPFPKLQYPLAEHAAANAAEEARCLAAAAELIDARGGSVAGMIVEPIQAEGGDHGATPEFFRALRELARQKGVVFIVDEVQTGVGATGHMWAHEKWELPHPPDVVSFSKKAQIGGYYYTDELQMRLPYRIYNTWMGDPAKLVLLKAILQAIEDEALIESTQQTGRTLRAGLEQIVAAHPGKLSNLRGDGTLLAVDAASGEARAELLQRLRSAGLLIGVCGDTAFRLRPALNFNDHHAGLFLDRFESCVAGL